MHQLLLLPQVKVVVYMGPGNPSALETLRGLGMEVHGWETFLAQGAAAPVEPSPPKPEDVACIMYTR